MKNLLLTLTLLFTLSINAQYAVMYAVDLNEGAEQDYLKLEAFWSEIHKEAIKQGSQNGWSVWKRTTKDGYQESAAEYFIFENYSSMEQMQKGYNAIEIATKVYNGKKSRRYIRQRFIIYFKKNSRGQPRRSISYCTRVQRVDKLYIS